MIGQKLSNRYEIAAELGRGGMGVVYRAHDPLLNRDVAIKLIPPTLLSPETEQRFQREAQLVAQMDHPAIVSIHDFGQHEGALFFVMPVVQGTTLRPFLRDRSLMLGDVIDIGIQVADALEYSHARGVVHRDIKPENIMVAREEGHKVRIRIMDFGLARAATESRITKTGTLIGTMAYLSPEQVTASGIDGRSDVYSLGTVLYECLVGEPPFSGEIQSILYRIVHETPQPPRSLGAEIDEELQKTVLGCLEKDPLKRPQKAGEIAEALRRYRSRLRDSDFAKSVALTRTLLIPRPALSPFVGRAKELGELQQRFNIALAGECQFVVLAGEPGIGKSRLLDELENLAKARRITVLHGRCAEQDGSFPYQGFFEAIQEYFLKGSSTPGPVADFSDLAADLVSLFPMLSEISDIRSAATGDSKLVRAAESQGPENRTHVFELLARTLTRIAGGGPIVVFLEDLHAAEVSIEALQYIVRRLGPTPTLIAATYRTTEVDSRHSLIRMLDSFRGDRHFSSMTLGPFSPSEHRLFLETLVGGPELANVLVEKLYDGTEGNPFFTKELVRSLLDSGAIARDDTGAWSLSAEKGISTDALPATIQQAVEKRVERLPEGLREILSIASVIGKAFDFRDLEVLAEGKGDLEDAVDKLVQDGLIEEERESRGDRLTFSSVVVRDVLYAGLSRRKRRSLHRRYAEELEQRHGGRLERVYPQLVYHFSQGDVADKTVQYGLRLARAGLDAFSAEEAARSAKTALEFLDEDWEGDRSIEAEARLLLAEAHRMAGEIDGALREAEAAIKIFERENHSRTVSALVLAAETAWQARRIDEATRFIQKGMEAARLEGDTEGLRHLLSMSATLANLRGEYEKANQYQEEAARLALGSKETEKEEEVPHGGTLVVAFANPVSATEPVAIRINEEREILTTVFETLLATDQDGNLLPALCEKWEVKDEGRSVLLKLRGDVRFQDGCSLTAAGVKNSFERAIRRISHELPAVFNAIFGVAEFAEGRANEVAGISIHSDDQLEIQLAEPLPIYPALLADFHAGITRVTSEDNEPVLPALGTGPFQIVSHDGERVVLSRNQDYWKGSPANLDAIEFRHGLSASAIASGLRSGELDLARDLLPQDLDEIMRDQRFRVGLVEVPRKNTYFILFNSRTGPASRDAIVRRALCGIVRTPDLVWQTLGRFAQPAVCLIPPGLLGHDAGRKRVPLTRDEALAMLAGAEIKGPIRLKASVHPLYQDRYQSLLGALFSTWADLGVEVSIETPTMASFLESSQQNEGLDLFISRWNAEYDDPDSFTYGLFHSHAGLYRAYFSSAEADQIVEDARAENRPAAREARYRRFENLLTESGILVPLFHDIDYRLANPKVRGLKLRSTAPYVNYAELGKAESIAKATETPWMSGGIIQVPIPGLLSRLDPSLLSAIEQGETLPSVFETLTRDVGGSRIVPWVAADFKVEEGGKRYRFRLRDDVRFHDGRRLTARDVRYSFERLLQNRDSECRWFYSSIRGARALLNGEAGDLAGFRIHSAQEFSIELDEPVSFFPVLLSFPGAAIIPEGTDQFGGSWQEGSVGTGPFRVRTFEPGRRLELERNKTYWRQGYPRSDGLVFSFGVPPAEILSGFRAGRFSLASDLFPADVEALRREPDFASGYRETPRLSTYYAAFNTHQGPLVDHRLRQSLVQAVDVATLVRQTLGRLAVPAHGLIPPGLLGYEPAHTSRAISAQLLKPEQLSAEIELTAALNPVYFGEYASLIRELERAFREQRVKIRPVTRTMAEFAEARQGATVDLVVTRWNADYLDADTFVHLLHSQEGYIGRFCGSPEIDRLIERGRAEGSPEVRHSLYRQIEEIIVRDALLLPLFHEQAYRFARPEVEGLAVSYWSPTVDYASLRIRG